MNHYQLEHRKHGRRITDVRLPRWLIWLQDHPGVSLLIVLGLFVLASSLEWHWRIK